MASKTILLAEDSPDDVFFFKRTLAQASVANPVHVVQTGQEALDYLAGRGPYADREAHPLPTVFFVDVRLPVFNGLEVLAWMRDRPEYSPVLRIVLTGMNWPEESRRADSLGAHAFLAKPVGPAELLSLVRYFPGYWVFSRNPPDR